MTFKGSEVHKRTEMAEDESRILEVEVAGEEKFSGTSFEMSENHGARNYERLDSEENVAAPSKVSNASKEPIVSVPKSQAEKIDEFNLSDMSLVGSPMGTIIWDQNDNACCIKNIFDQLRHLAQYEDLVAENEVTQLPTKKLSIVAEEEQNLAGRQVHERQQPGLKATLSNGKNRIRKAEKRRSLDERLLRSGMDLSSYSAEEREILAMIIRDGCNDKIASRLALSKIAERTDDPNTSKFVRDESNRRSASRGLRRSSSKRRESDEIEAEINGKSICLSKRATLFKRLVQSVYAKLVKTNFKEPVILRDSSIDSPRAKQRKYSISSKMNENHQQNNRRPFGNLELHTLLQEELKRVSNEHELLSEVLSIPEKVEKARTEYSQARLYGKYDSQHQQEAVPTSKTRPGLYRSSSMRQPLKEDEKVFEVFGQFKNDPFKNPKL